MLINQKDNFVSVIVVNYNSVKLLRKCLERLEGQMFRGFNTIVVDNGSNDESIPFLRANQDRFQLILNPRNIGFAAANNLGLQEAKTEWIALLNPDAFPEPEWLSNLMLAARTYPTYSFFASKTICAETPSLLDGTGDEYHVSGLVWRRGHGRKLSKEMNEHREVFSACAAAALYRRSALLKVGGFDEDFFCYVEDVDLGFRLRLAGYRCLYVPQATVFHVGSAATSKKSNFCVYHGHRNLVWTFLKNMPMPLLAAYFPSHIMLNLISILWFMILGKAGAILRSKRDALKGIPRILAKRRKIQSESLVDWRKIRRVLVNGFPRFR